MDSVMEKIIINADDDDDNDDRSESTVSCDDNDDIQPTAPSVDTRRLFGTRRNKTRTIPRHNVLTRDAVSSGT